MSESTGNRELAHFIEDWYWDDASHEFALQMGQFLFDFLDSLKESGMSNRTLKVYVDNCWCIGKLSCDYGYHDDFSPRIFLCGPSHMYEFKRKHSDSRYAVEAYERAWRKLERYVRSLEYVEEDSRYPQLPDYLKPK